MEHFDRIFNCSALMFGVVGCVCLRGNVHCYSRAHVHHIQKDENLLSLRTLRIDFRILEYLKIAIVCLSL